MSDERTALAQVLWDATRAQDPEEFMPTLMTDVGSCLQVADVLLVAGYRKAELVQIDREAIVKAIEQCPTRWDSPGIVGDLADAVIAHLAALHSVAETSEKPRYEYATTTGPRKSWEDENVPPKGDGWERDTDRGRNGWERFDYHEESYWRRPVAETTEPKEA